MRPASKSGGSSARIVCQALRMLLPREHGGAVVEEIERPAGHPPTSTAHVPDRDRRLRQVARPLEARLQPDDVLAGAGVAIALGVEEGPRVVITGADEVRVAPAQLSQSVAEVVGVGEEPALLEARLEDCFEDVAIE